ncbi:MAG: phosphodiester glycosidase family protein [Xenococcaceae cyanobacterium]
MSNQHKSGDYTKIIRRSFLFVLCLAVAKLLTEYFSGEKKRSSFFHLVKQLTKKAISLRSVQEPNKAPQTIPSTPIAQASPIATRKGKPIQVKRKTLNGVSFYQATIDLTDPEIFITIALANKATKANSSRLSNGDESFKALVARHPGAVVINGTFFSKDAQKRVMGNMVAGGRFLKYSRWENYGTTLGIRAGNKLEMITARTEGKPKWEQHWFSLTCGPRLLKKGKIWLAPRSEGFRDPHVLNVSPRNALGFSAEGNKLFLVTFFSVLSLEKEAQLMKAIGCFEAMNLDGGSSRALAHRGRILVPAGRPLTNVIVVYDTNNPAPKALIDSWQRFQNGERPAIPRGYL